MPESDHIPRLASQSHHLPDTATKRRVSALAAHEAESSPKTHLSAPPNPTPNTGPLVLKITIPGLAPRSDEHEAKTIEWVAAVLQARLHNDGVKVEKA